MRTLYMGNSTDIQTLCYHCGEPCADDLFEIEDKKFCCFGCKTVFEILQENDLCNYYKLQNHPGVSQKHKIQTAKYAILDRPDVRSRYVSFSNGKQMHLKFYLPLIHCSSCIWLLENLHALHTGIIQSTVDFTRKEIFIIADEQQITAKEIAGVLDSIGYAPYLSMQDLGEKKAQSPGKSRLIKMGVAGFCFGNIMLFSAPEYLAGGDMQEIELQRLFQFLSLFLSLPVFFYSATEFYSSSWKSLQNRFLNIDAPIALAIIITFVRSLWAVWVEHQGGYFDTMSGIVFFMLVGRYFQDFTYKAISFERDYRSYFPLAVSKVSDGNVEQIPLSELQSGDHYMVHNGELIPADSILIRGHAQIDYSFVTGESAPVEKTIGDLVYAGGRQCGTQLELRVIKDVSQSYLTQLWNNTDTAKQDNPQNSFIHLLSKHFSVIVMALSFSASVIWLFLDPSRALDALVTPLIIACPCALLLSSTFTYGNAITRLGRFGFYLKNAGVIEKMQHITTLVFDKTGTITQGKSAQIIFTGESLSAEQKACIYATAKESAHPYSRAMVRFLGQQPAVPITGFSETAGAGIEACVNQHNIKIGSAEFVGVKSDGTSASYISIDKKVIGRFVFQNTYIDGLAETISNLKKRFQVLLISGDNAREQVHLKEIFGAENQYYNFKPADKQQFIEALQQKREKVMMIGDGLNDAGA
ncbi:MAG: heavy metal translocating P-type ATPase, partial [Chitinophagales bacterium]